MLFSEALEIRPGLTAVMGSGGKTSLVCRLADELSAARVIIATSTHMRQVPALQTRVGTVAPGTPAIVGTPCGDGKFGPPEQSWPSSASSPTMCSWRPTAPAAAAQGPPAP